MGNRELVAGVGLLVEPDPTSIALALDQLAQDAGLRVQLTDLGLAAVRNWTWDRLARRVEQVYAGEGSALTWLAPEPEQIVRTKKVFER